MRMRFSVVVCAASLAASASAMDSKPLLKTTSTWDGDKIDYFSTQCPEVDAVVVSIPPNAATPIHLHPVNNYAYVLEGKVVVEEGDVVDGKVVARKTATFDKGDAFVEVVNTWHKGTAGPEGVKLLVWYTSEVGAPFTIVYSPEYKIDPKAKGSSRCLPQAPVSP
jgi:quercetin dioxygenase-like cupin family protein